MSWSRYDLALSEIGVDEQNRKAFIRIGSDILELSTGTPSVGPSLADVLSVDNISGPFDIIMGTGSSLLSQGPLQVNGIQYSEFTLTTPDAASHLLGEIDFTSLTTPDAVWHITARATAISDDFSEGLISTITAGVRRVGLSISSFIGSGYDEVTKSDFAPTVLLTPVLSKDKLEFFVVGQADVYWKLYIEHNN